MTTWRPEIDVELTDSEDEENEFKRDFKGREAMLFVVDANLYEEHNRFSQALEIIRGAFISGMLINDKDLMGVVFANTELSPEPYEPNCLDNITVPQNCAVFLPLRQLTKPIVEHFLRFLTTAPDDFGKQFGIAANGGSGSFATMIRLCLNLFDYAGYSLNNAKIVYMTDRNTPHLPGSHEYQVALQKASDLEGNEIEFHVIPMVDEFDYDVFYKEFLTLVRDVELDSFLPPDAQQLREILANRKLKQDFLKRCLGHFNFSLGPNLDLSAQYYNYYQRRSYPRKVKLLRKDNSVLKRKQVVLIRKQDPETMEFTQEKEVTTTSGWYEIKVGNTPIRISPEQMNRVRNLHAPGMMLLGFKPKSALPDLMYCKPANFMYPDDQSIIGSKRLFRALWQRCMAREKVPICLFMCKRKSIPRYVALVPVAAAEAESKSMRSLLSGDGFKIVYLPFQKNIRNINFQDWQSNQNNAPPEGVEVFEKVIKKLRIKYQPSLLNDPVLEVLQARLLALALDIKTENGELTDMPDAAMQDKRMSNVLLPNLEEIFGCDAESGRKRTTARATNETSAPKMPKTSDDTIKRFDDVEQLIANKSLASCTVAQLRFILNEHFGVKLAKTTTKQSLVDKIYELST